MQDHPSVIHKTFVIERNYPASPERVFSAFADPAKKRRWFFEGKSHELEHLEMDFRVGGQDHARSRFGEGSPIAGLVLTNISNYLDIVPNRRIVSAYRMTLGDNFMSASLATIEFLPAKAGTDLVVTHQGAYFEGSDGPEMREDGWRKLLDRLADEYGQEGS